jgi:hypothetical protein
MATNGGKNSRQEELMPKKLTVDRLDTDPLYATEAATLRVLTDGLTRIERESDVLRLEEHLQRSPDGPRSGILRDRLKKQRGAPKKPAEAATLTAGSPAEVTAALALVHTGAQVERRVDRPKQIQRLEDDAAVVRAGIMQQQQIVDEIRGTASAALAGKLREEHRGVVLQQFRTLQAAAAAHDELRQFRSSFLSAGFEFRSDLLPEPMVRAAMILGSEADHDSEISRTRRLLEGLKIL